MVVVNPTLVALGDDNSVLDTVGVGLLLVVGRKTFEEERDISHNNFLIRLRHVQNVLNVEHDVNVKLILCNGERDLEIVGRISVPHACNTPILCKAVGVRLFQESKECLVVMVVVRGGPASAGSTDFSSWTKREKRTLPFFQAR